VFLACHVIDPGDQELFHELWNELLIGEQERYMKLLLGRVHDEDKPRDKAEARTVLLGVVDRAMSRVTSLLAAHQERAEAEAASAADRLAFDDSEEGERLRRFQVAFNRALLRTLDAFLKFRRATDESGREGEPPGEPDGAEPLDGDPAPAESGSSVEFAPIDTTAPIDPTGGLISASIPTAQNAVECPAGPAETGAGPVCSWPQAGDNQDSQNEAKAELEACVHWPAVKNDEVNSQNEPTAVDSLPADPLHPIESNVRYCGNRRLSEREGTSASRPCDLQDSSHDHRAFCNPR